MASGGPGAEETGGPARRPGGDASRGGRDPGEPGGSRQRPAHAADRRASRLPEELTALGRSLDRPGADGDDGGETMVERVLQQILAEQVPTPTPVAGRPGSGERLRRVRHWARAHWRTLTAVLCGLLTALVLTPPVRASVADWFGFGGVEVRYDPSAVPTPGASVPGCGASVSPAEAERRAGFTPRVPEVLGTPDAMAVTRQPHDRYLISLCWREQGHTVRLDEFPARLDIGFVKGVREQPHWVPLARHDDAGDSLSDTALWFPRPHLLTFWLTDENGDRFVRSERTAGPTLLWTHRQADGSDLTLRLEGVASKTRALEIAKSLG
ncbi:hypothetical protein [Streptomyces acidicola]|uniref:hypothetical protein n=1 Tax=Streptomyces acidicola TaxID=2596892 RepID=UPI003422CB94